MPVRRGCEPLAGYSFAKMRKARVGDSGMDVTGACLISACEPPATCEARPASPERAPPQTSNGPSSIKSMEERPDEPHTGITVSGDWGAEEAASPLSQRSQWPVRHGVRSLWARDRNP